MFHSPSRRAARRPRPRSRCTSCRALRCPAQNDDLFDVGHLLLGERARAGWRRGRRRTCRGGLCPDCASRRCAPCPLRSASESTGPRARLRVAPVCPLPRPAAAALPAAVARRDRLSPAVLGRPCAASRRGVGGGGEAVVAPAACGEPLVVAVPGGPVGLEHPDPPRRARPALRGVPCLEHPDPPSRPSRVPPPWPPATRACGPSRPAPPILSVHAAAQAQVLGDDRRGLFAHDHKAGSGHNSRVLRDPRMPLEPVRRRGGRAARGSPGSRPTGPCLDPPPAVCWRGHLNTHGRGRGPEAFHGRLIL